MNCNYDHSIFYLTMSVYKGLGEANSTTLKTHPASKLITNLVLFNIAYKTKIGTHITFTTKQILDAVKSKNYSNFTGLVELGSNIAYPIETSKVSGDMNYKLLRHAIDSDGDVKGQIKIVVDDSETKRDLSRLIEEHGYPVTLVSSEEAFEELIEIKKSLEKEYSVNN